MKLDWRHALAALIVAAIAAFLALRATLRNPAIPTAPAPAGQTPVTNTPPE